MRKHTAFEERFWCNVKRGPADQCWLWIGTKIRSGYGHIGRGGHHGVKVRAHRASFELHCGPIPAGMWVLHSCDVPLCVNPAHLFLGTHRDNMADMTRKGRAVYVRGEKNGSAKLTAADVLAIRGDKRPGVVIAENYGVSSTNVSAIRSRHLFMPCPFRPLPPRGSSR